MTGEPMRRRKFITLLGGAAATWPLAARAQQGANIRRVGVLMNRAATEADGQSYLAAFKQGLRQLGWIEGQHLRIDVRWNAGDAGLARIYAAQLIGQMPDVILAASTTNLTVIRQATSAVPIVFVLVTDPVAQGFVPSMSRPGGNITGFTNNEFSVGGKWVDLLKEVSPTLSRMAVMFNPDTSPQAKFFMRAIESAAATLGVEVVTLAVRADADIEPALKSFASIPTGGLILPTDSFTALRHSMIAELATRLRVPSITSTQGFAHRGGLMTYGALALDQFHQAAGYVDRILKGERPGDLPVQGADRYKFIINLKTAKALGLSVPLPLLGLADEVIE
jgi:putative tryptophan/tyrosine transport system substrate-binding protein